MTHLTYAELFAGAGGLSMGLELAGWEPVAHAEIEPHARAVLREHWPDCRLDGDVSQVNGADYAGVTLLSGGSPCQDLSVAGKRAGMTEGSGTRSSLYYQQVRIWHESGAPYLLWENVLGAFSSNHGRDFAAVLSALVGAAIAVPADGWESAGVAAGPTGVAAWRVLDCQFFGPPQRRRRVFVLGARAGGVDPAEVLALSKGLRGDSSARGEAREGLAADAVGGADGAGGDADDRGAGDGRNDAAGRGRGVDQALAVNISDGDGRLDGVMGTLGARSGGQEVGAQTRGVGLRPASALGFHMTQDPISAGVSPALGGTTGGMAVLLRNREGKPGGGKGPLLSEERSLTRASANDQVLFTRPVVAPTFSAGAHPGGANGQDAPQVAAAILAAAQGVGIPRRLMPIETDRLMGWPDGHTAYGVAEDGTRYTLSDTARYRLCGNGVSSPVAAWIGWRLRWALEAATPTTLTPESRSCPV